MLNAPLSHSVAIFSLLIMLAARAEPFALPDSKPLPLPSSEIIQETLPPAPRMNSEQAADRPFQSMPKAQLARDIDAAYMKAHSAAAEDVTTGFDGSDKVFRIRTPLGANVCLNWRDVDRFNAGKGKRIFVLACNR